MYLYIKGQMDAAASLKSVFTGSAVIGVWHLKYLTFKYVIKKINSIFDIHQSMDAVGQVLSE